MRLNIRNLFPWSCLILLPAACTEPVFGDNSGDRFFAVTSDNDNYASRHDRHYTNAVRLTAGFPGSDRAVWRDWLAELMPVAHEPDSREFSLSLGQSLYTPQNITSPLPRLDDRPFAGWLYGELATTVLAPRVQETLAVNIGLVGPAALGRQAQELLHDITGDVEPRGWRNQIGNEPAVLIRYSRSWFQATEEKRFMDIVPTLGISLGNVVTEASASASLRLGSYLPQRHIPVSIQPSNSALAGHFESRRGRTDWLFHLGIGTRLVGHNLFLDGNTFKDSLSVERKPLVWNARAGIALTFGEFSRPLRFSFDYVVEGKEFEKQREPDRYGSVTFSLKY